MMDVGDRVVVLTSCGVGRWKAGEIGTLIENTYPEKYDFMVKFSDVVEGDERYRREFYFYKDELQPYRGG